MAADDGANIHEKNVQIAMVGNVSCEEGPRLQRHCSKRAEVPDHITKGEPDNKPPHNKGISGITEEGPKSIAEFVKTLEVGKKFQRD